MQCPHPVILGLRKEGTLLLFEFKRHMKTEISGVSPALLKLIWGLAEVGVPVTSGSSL